MVAGAFGLALNKQVCSRSRVVKVRFTPEGPGFVCFQITLLSEYIEMLSPNDACGKSTGRQSHHTKRHFKCETPAKCFLELHCVESESD